MDGQERAPLNEPKRVWAVASLIEDEPGVESERTSDRTPG